MIIIEGYNAQGVCLFEGIFRPETKIKHLEDMIRSSMPEIVRLKVEKAK